MSQRTTSVVITFSHCAADFLNSSSFDFSPFGPGKRVLAFRSTFFGSDCLYGSPMGAISLDFCHQLTFTIIQMHPRILAFAGSTRTRSFNKMLVRVAAESAIEQGSEVSLIDLRDFPIPLYDGDLEEQEGIPEKALELRRLMCAHHGLLLSCPEYNSAISAVLKNAIDWVSRPVEGEPSLAAFSGKTAALMATSPGALGGIRTLVSVRTILGNLGMIVMPKQFVLPNAGSSFDEHGCLTPELARNRLADVTQQLVSISATLAEQS